MRILQKKYFGWKTILIILGFLLFLIYQATSGKPTPYDYFTRLSVAFLQGKYFLESNPPWLNELIPISNGKFAVVYSPGPAIAMLPFVLVFGRSFEQQFLSQIMGVIAAYVWGLIVYKKTNSKISSLWMFIVAGLGNIAWYMSSNGSVWNLGQISAYLFTSLAIYEALNNKRPFLLQILVGMAFLSRPHTIFIIPVILY
ncbi:MAG: hypothetical protein GYA62_16620, partial [Bacteroidales bacterium]|nr:hypothetical protein [Bacteroidales bacterium]